MRHFSSLCVAAFSAASFLGLNSTLHAAAPVAVTSFNLPAPSSISYSVSTVFGSDGLLYVYDGKDVFKQDIVNTGDFTKISMTGSAGVDGSDAGSIAFIHGNTIIVGTGAGGQDFIPPLSGGQFLTLPSAGGAFSAPLSFTVPRQYSFTPVPSTSAVNASGNFLAVNQAKSDFSGSSVSFFDVSTGTNTQVIKDIPGASSAVAFDAAGNLYVGDGYSEDTTGIIRRFDLAALDAAYSSGTPIAFLSGDALTPNGEEINTNSGTGYFESGGYLFAGGGFFSDFTTIAPNGAVTPYDFGAEFASITYNPFNDQFAVINGVYNPLTFTSDFSATIYEASSFVPEPGCLSLLFVGSALLLRRGRRVA